MDWSTNARKQRSKTQSLKITYFLELNEPNFQVNVLGSTKKPYQLYFFTDGVECTCMDFKLRHRICKHLFFIIGKVSQSNQIYENIKTLDDFTPAILKEIKDNLNKRIDAQKQEQYNSNDNQISIERDDYCAICMEDFEQQQNLKCETCEHVFHQLCLQSWWNVNYQNANHCAMCRSKSFVQPEDNNPWTEFVN